MSLKRNWIKFARYKDRPFRRDAGIKSYRRVLTKKFRAANKKAEDPYLFGSTNLWFY